RGARQPLRRQARDRLFVRADRQFRHEADRQKAMSIWISPRDLTQLVRIGLEHPDIRYEIVYGVSNNQRSWYDNSNAYRLGYKPADNSEPYAEAVLAAEPPNPDPIAERYQGPPRGRIHRKDTAGIVPQIADSTASCDPSGWKRWRGLASVRASH